MLGDKIKNAVKQMEIDHKVKKGNKHVEEYNRALEVMENDLVDYAYVFSLLKHLDGIIPIDRETCVDLLEKLEYCKHGIEKVTVRFEDVKDIDRAFQKFKNDIELRWKEYARLAASQKANSLTVLSSVTLNRGEAKRVAKMLEQYKEKLPADKLKLDEFQHYLNMADKLLEQIEAPKKIEKFIIKVKNSEATVKDLLDDEIIEWLKNKRYASKIKLVFDD